MTTSEVHKLPSIYNTSDEIVKVKNKELSETSRLIADMKTDKKVVVSDIGLCNFWAITWLAAWYIFSGINVKKSFENKLKCEIVIRFYTVPEQVHPHLYRRGPHDPGNHADGGHPGLWLPPAEVGGAGGGRGSAARLLPPHDHRGRAQVLHRALRPPRPKLRRGQFHGDGEKFRSSFYCRDQSADSR